MSKTLVIVESPGKIKKIQAYLGSNYVVKASFGHVYDLNPKGISVDVDNNFKPEYQITPDKRKVVAELKNTLKNCKEAILAADDDREGEAIAWSLAQVLKLTNPKRMIFHEITKKALQESLKNIGKINDNLVEAQQTRRVLDRIVGYKLSPILWNNIGPKLSAGRVQSVVTKLVVDRENEINNKDCMMYYRFSGLFHTNKKEELKGTLHELKSQTKNTFKGDIVKLVNKAKAKKLLKLLGKCTYKIANINKKKSKRNAPAPFTTSTLQQEAQRKCRFPVKKTMMLAQKLYEGGHITYMRTDAVNLSEDILVACKDHIIEKYGQKYHQLKKYKSKSKNAQEAHEAIRPTKIENTNMGSNPDEKKLYELIRKRTLASQMSPAQFENLIIQSEIKHNKLIEYFFQFTNSKLIFDGFLKVYDVEIESGEGFSLNEMPKIEDDLEYQKLEANIDTTRPPARYTEASLVKKLEELGIGRPSTFATMISKIQERQYVEKGSVEGKKIEAKQYHIKKGKDIKASKKTLTIGADKNKLLPTELGMNVTKFLEENFCNLMDYKFTSDMESKLDLIVDGKESYNNLLKTFYKKFKIVVTKLLENKPNKEFDQGKVLGNHPDGGEIFALRLKNGPVVRMKIGEKWKYGSIKRPDTLNNITLEKAIKLLSYPKMLGRYEDSPIMLNKGKFGFYLTWGDKKVSLEDENIDLENAINIIKLKEKDNLGIIKDGKSEWSIRNGKYGMYAMKKGVKPTFVSLPNNIDASQVTLEMIKEQQVKKAGKKPYKKKTFTKKKWGKS